MTAADDQRDVRLDLAGRAEKRREQVSFEMIDREVWLALSDRQPFGDDAPIISELASPGRWSRRRRPLSSERFAAGMAAASKRGACTR